jgi:hypothetical protein
MKKIISLFFFYWIVSNLAFAQLQPAKPHDSQYYLNLLTGAKDSLYNEILHTFNTYIDAHPGDYIVQIERCKLIEEAYYNYDDEYNPHYEEAEYFANL